MNDPDKRIAVIVDPSLPLGLLANTVATIGIGIGAAAPGFGNSTLTDLTRRSVQTSANRPVPILQASPEGIGTLLLRAFPVPDGGILVPFPRFARNIHLFADYLADFPQRDLGKEIIEGLGVAGPGKWVKSLTGNLKLLR